MSEPPVLDPAQLQSLLDLGVEPALIQELIGLYEADVPQRIAALEAALEAGDASRFAEEAHQLKGSLGNLGLLRFADLARALELMGHRGRLEGAGPLVTALPGEFREGTEALKAAFPG